MKRDEGLDSGKLTTYFMFKENFTMENYMYIKSHEIRKSIFRFRISAHDLRIETGRYEFVKNNAGQRIPLERNKRIRLMSNQNCIEDEYHFLTECQLYTQERQNFFHYISLLNKNFILLSKGDKFFWLITKEDNLIITQLSEYLVKTFKIRHNAMNLHK
jgi:hypothetical protein